MKKYKMEIYNEQKYNKLCAVFLELTQYKGMLSAYYWEGLDFIPKGTATENLKFHSDWNWIMEVVEKIEALGFNRRVDIDSSHTLIQYKDWYTLIQKESKRESIVHAIWEFLNWYNEQKS